MEVNLARLNARSNNAANANIIADMRLLTVKVPPRKSMLVMNARFKDNSIDLAIHLECTISIHRDSLFLCARLPNARCDFGPSVPWSRCQALMLPSRGLLAEVGCQKCRIDRVSRPLSSAYPVASAFVNVFFSLASSTLSFQTVTSRKAFAGSFFLVSKNP